MMKPAGYRTRSCQNRPRRARNRVVQPIRQLRAAPATPGRHAQLLPVAARHATIRHWAHHSDLSDLREGSVSPLLLRRCAMATLVSVMAGFVSVGCAQQHAPKTAEPPAPPPEVVVVAPVLNLSNSSDWDPLRATDILASELQALPDVVVIPVNRTLAALALMGREAVESPEDALELAAEFNADATIVAGLTEYNPYEPPVVGVVMQWYAPLRQRAWSSFDPVTASRQAADIAPAASAEHDPTTPVVQVQRVYNAADDAVQRELRAYAAHRRGHDSPYAWQIHLKAQELYLRYCFWASIRTMQRERYHGVCNAIGTER